jgi:hypothetical protein
MSGLAKTVKKVTNPKYLKDKLKSVAEDIGDTFKPEVPVPEEQTIIPIPTASTSKTEARKKRAKGRASGRSSTILTEGLGG